MQLLFVGSYDFTIDYYLVATSTVVFGNYVFAPKFRNPCISDSSLGNSYGAFVVYT